MSIEKTWVVIAFVCLGAELGLEGARWPMLAALTIGLLFLCGWVPAPGRAHPADELTEEEVRAFQRIRATEALKIKHLGRRW